MRVLVACEYSGIVRDAFTERGHEAMSCDLRPSESPNGLHFQGSIWDMYQEADRDYFEYFDLLIAHPPCTHLAVSGAKHFKQKIADGRQGQALDFVKKLMSLPIEKICIENPVSIISTQIRKPDQIIQPWMFGDPFTKTTCLWLKGLPPLVPTNVVDKGEFVIHGGKRISKWYSNREFARDKTFQGIADAMASQWGRI